MTMPRVLRLADADYTVSAAIQENPVSPWTVQFSALGAGLPIVSRRATNFARQGSSSSLVESRCTGCISVAIDTSGLPFPERAQTCHGQSPLVAVVARTSLLECDFAALGFQPLPSAALFYLTGALI
jgi:hypothetical protein